MDRYRVVLLEALGLMRKHGGVDFTGYRQSMLLRRVRARMATLGLDDPELYLSLLRTDVAEVSKLVDHIAVNTSYFFRDPQVWDFLAENVLPELESATLESATPVMIWSAGCASGEEVYTIKMLVAEYRRRSMTFPDTIVFGTDIDQGALRAAENAIYPIDVLEWTRMGIVNRYFESRRDGTYALRDALKSRVQFSRRDLLAGGTASLPREAVFAHFDLVCCRNVLIYQGPENRARILSSLIESVRPGGYLVLGLAEAAPEDDRLAIVNRSLRIFRRRRDTLQPRRRKGNENHDTTTEQ